MIEYIYTRVTLTFLFGHISKVTSWVMVLLVWLEPDTEPDTEPDMEPDTVVSVAMVMFTLNLMVLLHR